MPRPPRERSTVPSAWVKGSKIRGSISGGIPVPVSRTLTTHSILHAFGREGDLTPGVRVLRGVGEEIDEDLFEPGRVPLDRHGGFGCLEVKPMAAFLEHRADGVDRALEDFLELDPSPLKLDFAAVDPATSSRSSISRARCLTCRAMTCVAQSASSSMPRRARSWTALVIADIGLRSSWERSARKSSLRRSFCAAPPRRACGQ